MPLVIQKQFLLKDVHTAKEIPEALVSAFSRVGIPEVILTDQGRQFTANYMQELVEILEMKHLIYTPYHPMCNGYRGIL